MGCVFDVKFDVVDQFAPHFSFGDPSGGLFLANDTVLGLYQSSIGSRAVQTFSTDSLTLVMFISFVADGFIQETTLFAFPGNLRVTIQTGSDSKHRIALWYLGQKYTNERSFSKSVFLLEMSAQCSTHSHMELKIKLDQSVTAFYVPATQNISCQAFGSDEADGIDASPILHVGAFTYTPPYLMLCADYRPQVPVAAQAFLDALEQANLSGEVISIPNKDHGSINEDIGKPEEAINGHIERFLRECFC